MINNDFRQPHDTRGPERRGLPPTIRRAIGFAECLTWLVGAAALSAWAWLHVTGAAGAHRELERFAAMRAAAALEAAAPDQTLWSPTRVRAWRGTLVRATPAPLAVLRIPRIGLEAPVLEGTDEWTLNRAVGHVADTAGPGDDGNCAIAGHRDGFFRRLKDVAVGDDVELDTIRGVELYRVERIWIVEPADVSVLGRTAARALTLVTCYPFYFVGSAPHRFIVRAVRAASAHG